MVQVAFNVNNLEDLDIRCGQYLSDDAASNLHQFVWDYRNDVDTLMEYLRAYYDKDVINVTDLEDMFSDEDKYDEICDFFRQQGDYANERDIRESLKSGGYLK